MPVELSPEVTALLQRALAARKGRKDIEILGLVGAGPGLVLYRGIQYEPGVTLQVSFTYTSGRRIRRTGEVTWPIGIWHRPDEPDPNMPAALWGALSAALYATATLD